MWQTNWYKEMSVTEYFNCPLPSYCIFRILVSPHTQYVWGQPNHNSLTAQSSLIDPVLSSSQSKDVSFLNILTFKGGTGQHPIQCASYTSERENIVPQWAFNLSSAAATAEAWYLKGQMLKAKQQIHPISAQGCNWKCWIKFSSFVWCLCAALTS